MKKFSVPPFYRSGLISELKRARLLEDPKRRDPSPSVLDLGVVVFKIARHFGFCYGVENAIEIAYRAIDENSGKRVFLLSEMIYNPEVNRDLSSRGVSFLMATDGSQLIDFSTLTADDIVIVPAFGTTLEIQEILRKQGIDSYLYDTTCPFVEKVWKRSSELGKRGFTVIIHGKPKHEETRATFSHSYADAPSLIVRDIEETELLVDFITGKLSEQSFRERFQDQSSANFDPNNHLKKIGVVNQTTMLATETTEIASRLRQAMMERYGEAEIAERFADTGDTLCYATYENQTATKALISSGADIAVVVGGYNSSNTSHLVELCEERIPTFFVKDALELISADEIRHFDLKRHEVLTSADWLPKSRPVTVAITSGASCPDAIVEQVLEKIGSFCGAAVKTMHQTAA